MQNKSIRGVMVLMTLLFLVSLFLGSFPFIHSVEAANEKINNEKPPELLDLSEMPETKVQIGKTNQGWSIYASTEDDPVVYAKKPRTRASGDTGWGGRDHITEQYGSYTFITRWLSSKDDHGEVNIAYCMDPGGVNPTGETYTASVYDNDGCYNIVARGYGYKGTTQRDYTDTEAALRIWCYSSYGADWAAGYAWANADVFNDPGVQNLLWWAQQPRVSDDAFKISASEQTAKYVVSSRKQETDWYTPTSNANYNFTLPAGVYAQVEGESLLRQPGNRVDLNNARRFKLLVDVGYRNTVIIHLDSDQWRTVPIMFNPDDTSFHPEWGGSGYLQRIMSTTKGYTTGTDIKAIFQSRPVFSHFVKSDDETLVGLEGAHLQVFKKDTNELIAEADTDELGHFDVQLYPGEYYLKETKAPYDHVLSTEPINFTVTGYDDSMTTNVPNAAKKIPFSFKKINENNQPMEGVEFKLYACKYDKAYSDQTGIGPDESEKHSHSELAGAADSCWITAFVDVKSDVNGLVNLNELRSGEYQLVEVKTKAGYQLPKGQWRVYIDAELNTIDLSARGTALPPAFEKTALGLQVKNYPSPKMPYAGVDDNKEDLIIILGFFLLGLGATVYYKKTERNQNKGAQNSK